jgi:hypothetical protein
VYWQAALAEMKPSLDTVLRLAISYTTTHAEDHDFDHVKVYHKLPKATVDLTAELWKCVHPKLYAALKVYGSITQQIQSLMAEVNHQINALAGDKVWDECYANAVKDIPLPKTLAKAGVVDPDLESTK